MTVKITVTVETSPMGADAQDIQRIITEALSREICPFPYSINIKTEELNEAKTNG